MSRNMRATVVVKGLQLHPFLPLEKLDISAGGLSFMAISAGAGVSERFPLATDY